MRKIAAILLVCLFVAVAAKATEKLKHRVQLKQVNEWQGIISCRNGRTPTLNSKDIAGSVLVSCEGREQGDE